MPNTTYFKLKLSQLYKYREEAHRTRNTCFAFFPSFLRSRVSHNCLDLVSSVSAWRKAPSGSHALFSSDHQAPNRHFDRYLIDAEPNRYPPQLLSTRGDNWEKDQETMGMIKEYHCGETSVSNWSKNVTHNGCLFSIIPCQEQCSDD